MNISLALVKARQVCRVVKDNGCWEVEVPIDLGDLDSDPVRHMCDSYKEAINRCANAVARVAVLQKFPSVNNVERAKVFGRMRRWQTENPGATAVEIARFGVRYIESGYKL
jgi:hypothetical protein